MMDNESKKKKKKKRGKSLIFKTFFRSSSSGDDPSATGGKVLASDDNLVYCDVNGNCVEPEPKKSSSSRGRMSRIFKGVLFDTVVKKKKSGKKSEETPTDSADSSPVKAEKFEKIETTDRKIETTDQNIEKTDKTENSISEINNSNDIKNSEVENSPPDLPRQYSLSSRTAASPVSSPRFAPITTTSQTLTERKVSSTDKKPPLPSNTRPSPKPIPKEDHSKFVAKKCSRVPLFLFILLGILVLAVIVWMKFAAIAGGSSDLHSDQYRNDIVAGGDL